MSLHSYVMDIEDAAEAAALRARAIYHCPAHPDVPISAEDHEAERHAYALMTLMWKQQGSDDDRDRWMDALADYMGQSTDGCPACEICAAA